MTRIIPMLDFYMKDAWKKDENGVLHPSPELLADQGKRAYDYLHAEPKRKIEPEHRRAAMLTIAAEISDCLRDLLFAINMPPSESQNLKVGSLCSRISEAEYSLREMSHG